MRLLTLSVLLLSSTAANADSCSPVFVRWPRVKLNVRAVAQGPISLRACQSACTLGEDPIHADKTLECAALNHEDSLEHLSNHCQVFQPHQLQNVDGFVEADERYSFYWKYCLSTSRKCSGEFAFTYFSDRFIESSGVSSSSFVSSLEECLALCLDHPSISCRSVSFNRTDGGCHLSSHSQLTRPHSIKINNNPNFRIDYYENNCYNMSETFTFSSTCEENGIRVKVDSRLPYTGALYGLYDFFTCRIEPHEENKFEYFFPSPTISKNCSDSIRYKGDEMVLEVVLSTDGVEPLYFITPEDITFQAKCPMKSKSRFSPPSTPKLHHLGGKDELNATAHTLFKEISQSMQKDTFPLPLTTTRAPFAIPTTSSTTTTVRPSTTTQRTTTTPKTTTTTTTTTPRPTTTTTQRPTTTTSTTTTTTSTTTTTTTSTTPLPPRPTSTLPSTTSIPALPSPPSPQSPGHSTVSREPISMDIFHNGTPVGAVVVGSSITLSFTPHFAIPPEYMSLRGCQVEPIGSSNEWEREPLEVIKEGCPSDRVGIACPPQHTSYGLKVKMEAFRYQTTADIQYTCLVRVCPFGECPVEDCSPVDGCNEGRGKRALSLEEIRAALQADPSLGRHIQLMSNSIDPVDTKDQLMALAGDHVVKKRLVVVNSPDELRYFVSTGTLPL
ncbi:hypothetical protein PMAYCL1PPCAC_18513 [Pristionchus mayeri]|uniref:Uncharacterized protein n=1 Tax=Pristionchus mayeri TaxID=1317129 RepID=A0AAN5CPL3_9BILA|nr:hypothetical protein PMAYCL1PPCAC_18513 [Pristionchus mayeri]